MIEFTRKAAGEKGGKIPTKVDESGEKAIPSLFDLVKSEELLGKKFTDG